MFFQEAWEEMVPSIEEIPFIPDDPDDNADECGEFGVALRQAVADRNMCLRV